MCSKGILPLAKTSTEKFVLRTLCFKKKKSITNKRILTILSLDFLIVDRG